MNHGELGIAGSGLVIRWGLSVGRDMFLDSIVLSQFLPRCPFGRATPCSCWVWAAAGATFGWNVLTGISWLGWAVYHPTNMFNAFMEACTYKAAWRIGPTGLEAAVAQLAALRADRVHSCFPVLLCLVPGSSKADIINEKPPSLL